MRDIKDIWQIVKNNPGIKPREIMLILIPGCKPINGDITPREARKIERLYRAIMKIERGIAKRGVKK